MPELKPCPFCGGTGLGFHDPCLGNNWTYVICGKCDANGPLVIFSGVTEFHLALEKAEQEAIELWNRREG